MTTKQLIKYERDGEWGGYTLEQRLDGLWRFESWSAVQGTRSGRVVVIQEPDNMDIKDEADLDTVYYGTLTKAEYIIYYGQHVRCLHRGWIIQ